MPVNQEEFDALTLIEIAIRFKSDLGALIEWLQANRMLASHMWCQSCGTQMNWAQSSRDIDQRTWRCPARNCRKKTNIRKGSFFEKSHLQLWQIHALTYLWASSCGSSRGPSYDWIKKELGIGGNETVGDWFQFCRDICGRYFDDERPQIGGPGVVVEIDESLFAKRKNNVGRVVPQQWVFGGYDTTTKHGFLVMVPDRTANTLEAEIIRWIRPGTIIHSDCWTGYHNVSRHGYTHRTVNHSRNFVDPDTGVCTNQVEGMWSRAKAKFKAIHGTSRGLIEEYLNEYMWSQRFGDHAMFHLWDQITTRFYNVWDNVADQHSSQESSN